MFTLVLMAISLSIDSFIIGFTYGALKIKIKFIYKFIIAIISFLITFFALSIGSYLKNIFSNKITNLIGSSFLFLMGINLIRKSFYQKQNNLLDEKKIIKTKIKKPIHAFFLGFALSIDSIGSGIAFSLVQNNTFFLPILTAAFQYIFLSLGIFFGRKILFLNLDQNKLIFISGLILIFFSLIKII